MKLFIGLVGLAVLSGCAAYTNTVTEDAPGKYQVKAVEAPDVWATNTTALDYNLNNQADKLCPGGWERGALTKAKESGDVVYYTTITCTNN